MRLFSDDSTHITDPFLRRAYRLAYRGLGTTSPNPMVGCVIVRDGQVVGEGWHERAGGPHAEVVALEHAGSASEGATAYVTLEPCAHHGRTPPCTDALTKARVSHVVIGMSDPSATASGGADRLRAAGIDVSFAANPAPFESLNVGWHSLVTKGRPWTTVKVACSLDGKVSSADDVRTHISSEGSRHVTMRLRAMSDAVLVGAHTATVDDPALTVRSEAGVDGGRQPLRLVLTRSTDPSAATLFGDGRGPAVLLSPEALRDTLDAGGADVWGYPEEEGLAGALHVLGNRGIARLLIESGPRLFASLWDGGLVDEVVLVHAGGVGGQGWAGLYGAPGTNGATDLERRMRAVEAMVAGEDAVTVWRRVSEE